jgi:DNA-binding transcriptional LysR family regulator
MFLADHPKANVRLEYQHPHRVYETVEKDLADLGLVSYPRASRTIEAIPWREEPMVLVTSPGHRLASAEKIRLEELAGENMVGFDADLPIRHEIDRVLAIHGVDVRVAMEFDNVETIKRAVEIDAGVALLPEPTVLREVEAGSLSMTRLDTDELTRPLAIICRRNKELGITARRFIELLQHEGNVNPPLSASVESGSSTSQLAKAAAASVNGHAKSASTPRRGGRGRRDKLPA